jgi:hypothetical protein
MKQHLVSQVFDIQKQINAVLPAHDDCEFFDQEMFVVQKNSLKINVLWRDNSYEYQGTD